jgi:hypothetical protein
MLLAEDIPAAACIVATAVVTVEAVVVIAAEVTAAAAVVVIAEAEGAAALVQAAVVDIAEGNPILNSPRKIRNTNYVHT